MEKGKCEVVKREGEEVMVKFMPADNVWRRVEKLSEKGMLFAYVFMGLCDVVNEQREDGKNVMEVIDADRGRNHKGEPLYEVKIRLGEGGTHLKDEDIEYIIDWALEEYGKKEVDKRIGYLPF